MGAGFPVGDAVAPVPPVPARLGPVLLGPGLVPGLLGPVLPDTVLPDAVMPGTVLPGVADPAPRDRRGGVMAGGLGQVAGPRGTSAAQRPVHSPGDERERAGQATRAMTLRRQ